MESRSRPPGGRARSHRWRRSRRRSRGLSPPRPRHSRRRTPAARKPAPPTVAPASPSSGGGRHSSRWGGRSFNSRPGWTDCEPSDGISAAGSELACWSPARWFGLGQVAAQFPQPIYLAEALSPSSSWPRRCGGGRGATSRRPPSCRARRPGQALATRARRRSPDAARWLTSLLTTDHVPFSARWPTGHGGMACLVAFVQGHGHGDVGVGGGLRGGAVGAGLRPARSGWQLY